MKLDVGRMVSTGAVGNAFLTKPSLGELDRGSRKKGTKDRPGFFGKRGSLRTEARARMPTDASRLWAGGFWLYGRGSLDTHS
jgi:hypothetical protein